MFQIIKKWFEPAEPTAEQLEIVAKKQQQIFIRNMIQEIVTLATEQAKSGRFYAEYLLPPIKDSVVEDAVKHRLTILGYKFKEELSNRKNSRYLCLTWGSEDENQP